jgi:hypothetical protein
MLYNKKGLSTIVTTLIIILLVLVAIGIIWVVIRGVIEQGTSQITIDTKCLNTDVRATRVVCSAGSCDVTLLRKAGSDAMDGVKLVFHNNLGNSSAVLTGYTGDITLLATQQATGLTTGITLPTTAGEDSVDVVPYFKDEKGQERLCTQVNTFSF